MVLKDIKNDPSVSGGLERLSGSLKRRMTEPGCSVQCKSRFGKGHLETDKDCGFIGSRSEQNMNICTNLTNTSLALQDIERNESSLCKTDVSVQNVLKNNNGIVSPVLIKEILPPLPHEIQFSSPDCNPASNTLGTLNMSLSYFADPTVPNEEQESAAMSSINGKKYFSTPMPTKERVKKKLTPVMEVDFEPNMSEEWQPQGKVSRTDLLHANSYCADVLSHESPTKTPLYRSFFAAECQEIVKQIESIETVVRSPVKRKVEEFDVSTIDAEPPPYDCTPMKSMLACEVATMMCSLESSPIKEGQSLFGESLLDLEKTDMQLNDFNLSECGIKTNNGYSLSDTEGLSLLSDRLDGVCAKTEPLEKIDWGVNHVNQVTKMSTLPNVLHSLTLETPAMESFHIYATSKFGDEGVTAVISNNVLHAEHKLTDIVTEPAVLTQDMAVAQNVSLVIKASPQAMVRTMTSSSPVHERTTACDRQLSDTDEHKLFANTTQDIVGNYDELLPTDTTHVIEISKESNHPRPSITSIHEELNTANATQMIEILSHTSNTTQEIPFIQEEYSIANTTLVIEMAGMPSGNTTQDIASVHDDATSGNTTQVIDVVPLSANTTQDITPMHEVVTVANATPVIEVGPQFSANTTQDIPSMNESKTANTTHEIEVVPLSCANTTPDIAAVHEAVLTANTTQVVEIVPKTSAKRPPGTSSTHDEITTSCTEDVGVMQKLVNDETPSHCTDAVPKALCNVKESFESSSHNETMPVNHDHLFKVTQPSLNMDLDVPAQHSVVISDLLLSGTTGTNTEISVSNSDLNTENKKDLVMQSDHENISKLDPTHETLVVNDVKELLPVEPEAQTILALTRVTNDPSTLDSPPAQDKLNVIEGQKLEGYEKCSNSCAEMASSYKQVDICKESRKGPLVSESCSMIQEEENAHDVSVFSVGSLSFVTSTPVPGLNFQFQKICRDSVQQDPNLSIGSVLDDSANTVPREQRMIPQHRSHDPQGLECKDHEKQETSHGSLLLPPSMQRNMVPPSEVVPKQIPSTSACRSLVLHQNSQNPAREPAVSKTATRGGIPGRGMIRPPLAHQSLPRASLVSSKQAMEGTGGSNITNKLTGNRFKTPKAAATTVVKARSATTHSQLPIAPSSVKPPSRLGVPGSTGRPTIGGHNAAANLHETSGEMVSAVRPPISTGIRTGLPRSGTTSIRPPLPQSQKVSLKLKSQVPGLPTKKNQKELPTLGSRREIGSKPESTSIVRSTAKQAALALDFPKEVGSLQVGIQASSSPNDTVQTKAKNHKNVQSSLSSKEEIASITATSTELSESGHERCQHLEMCKCCHVRYRQLLQENEDLKRRIGHIQHTQVEMTHMAGT